MYRPVLPFNFLAISMQSMLSNIFSNIFFSMSKECEKGYFFRVLNTERRSKANELQMRVEGETICIIDDQKPSDMDP